MAAGGQCVQLVHDPASFGGLFLLIRREEHHMVPLKDLAPEILRGLSVPREALGWSGKAWDSADADNFLWRRDAASWRVRILDGGVRLPASHGAPLASHAAPLAAQKYARAGYSRLLAGSVGVLGRCLVLS